MEFRKVWLWLLVVSLGEAAPLPALANIDSSLTIGQVERTFSVHLPPTPKNNGQPLPLVLVLHGGAGNAENGELMTGFSTKADREGFIAVYVNGSGRFGHRLLTWNARHCCGYAMDHQIDEVTFFNALLDHLETRYPVDKQRIYLTGMSNGGMMTHQLGIALSQRLAAIAPVVATLFGDEPQPAAPVPALIINGLLDQAVPNQGGAPGGRFDQSWDGTPTLPALAQGRFWAKANHCQATPAQSETATTLSWSYACPAGHEVELVVVKDNGHAWPGGRKGSRQGDEPSHSVDATKLIWDFFAAHSRQPATQ